MSLWPSCFTTGLFPDRIKPFFVLLCLIGERSLQEKRTEEFQFACNITIISCLQWERYAWCEYLNSAGGRKYQRILCWDFFSCCHNFPTASLWKWLQLLTASPWHQKWGEKTFIYSSESVTHSTVTLVHLLFSNSAHPGCLIFFQSCPLCLIWLL